MRPKGRKVGSIPTLATCFLKNMKLIDKIIFKYTSPGYWILNIVVFVVFLIKSIKYNLFVYLK